MEEAESFSFSILYKTTMVPLATSTQHNIVSPSRESRHKNKEKESKLGSEEVRLCL
jgi:hypothetical protein